MPLRSTFALGALLATAAAAGAASLAAQCPTYCPPEVSLAAHHPDMVGPSASDATLSYTTPAYVSMDVPRAVSLFYSSHQAAPYAYLQVDVRTTSGTPPQATSIQVINPATGVVLSPERFYAGAETGVVTRMAAQKDMSTFATGSYPIRVIVRSYWNNGAQVQSVTRDTRVLVVNERGSRFGAGWSMPGLQRIHPQANQDVVLTRGDGTGMLFRLLACQTGFRPICTYASPRGDRSVLTSNPQTGVYTHALPDGTTSEFNGFGQLQYVENRFGHRTSYTWQIVSGTEVPSSVTDPAGKVTLFGYNGSGFLSTIRTPSTSTLRQTTFAYSSTQLLRITEPDGTVAVDSIGYDAGYRLLRWKSQGQHRWDVAYDHTHSIHQVQAPQITTNTSSLRPSTEIRSLREMTLPAPGAGTTLVGRVPAVRLDSLWVRVTDATGDSAVAAPAGGFDTPGRTRDANGLIGRTYVDSLGRDTLVLTPRGDTVRYTWTGRLLTRISGGRTLNQYNVPMPKWLQDYTYTTFDQVASTSGTGQRPRYFHYGSLGQLDSVTTNIVGRTTRYTYGSDWRLTSVTDPTGLVTTYHRSGTGWMNTDSVRSAGRRVAYTYDLYGRPQQTTNPLGHTTSTSYDVLNRVLTSTDERNHTTTFGYGVGGLTQVTDALSQTYGFQRNVLGWTEVATDPRGQGEALRYTPVGNVARYVNRRGDTITTEYDERNRPLSVSSGGTELISYEYDPDGRWTVIATPAMTDTIHTDTAGRVVRESTVRGEMLLRVQTQRHHDGRPYRFVSYASSSNAEITFGYDADRVTSVMFAGVSAGLLYNSVEQVRQVNITAPNVESTIQFGFTSEHALNSITYSQAAVHSAFGVSYDRDLLGRIRERGRPLNDTSRSFHYDPAGQLLGYADSALVPICEWNEMLGREFCRNGRGEIGSQNYAYDAVGNRTGSGIVLDPAKGNRLVAFGGYTLQYDANGSLTRKMRSGFDQRLYWNPLGQLDSVVTVRNGSTTRVAFQYDGLGRRATKAVNGTVTHYVYSGSHVMIETDGSGVLQAAYSYLPGIDLPFSMRRGGSTYLYAREANGNVSGLFTPAGQVVARYRYGPWGELEHETTGGVKNPFRFTGREWDPETGLYYYRARYYDPQIGRFVSEDPIGLAGGINPYAYAANDPVNLRDPSGLRPRQPCPFGILGDLLQFLGRCEPLLLDPVIVEAQREALDASRIGRNAQSGPRMPPGGLSMGSQPQTRMTLLRLLGPGGCLIENGDVDVKYGAAIGVGASVPGLVEVGAEFDAGSLNAGSSGFALTQGTSATAGLLNLGVVGCQVEARTAWTSHTETQWCGVRPSVGGGIGTSPRGRLGVGVTLGAGVSAGLNLPGFARCVIGR